MNDVRREEIAEKRVKGTEIEKASGIISEMTSSTKPPPPRIPRREKIKKDEITATETIDYTSAKPNFSITFEYNRDFEMPIACYALTKMVQDHARYAGDVRKFTDQPSSMTIFTNIKEKTKIFRDIVAVFDNGIIAGVYIGNIEKYIVEILACSEENLRDLESLYSKYVSGSNFYKGKCLKFTRDGLSFVSNPDKTLDDIVLPENLIKEFKLNVIEFLQDEKLHSVIKKRSLIIHGPPGVGKTSLISATFTELLKHNITCVFMSDDVFRNYSLDWILTLINKYLTPACLVFEDIDLIGYDRTASKSNVIGPLLSILDGIEPYKQPIVIIATTNRFEVLDKALTRPVRFDRRLEINYPSPEQIKELFKKIIGCSAPRETLQGKEITGAHIQEIFSTAFLMVARNGGKIEQYVKPATETVLSNFFLSQSVVGFKVDEEYIPDKTAEDGKECKPNGNSHWERRRS